MIQSKRTLLFDSRWLAEEGTESDWTQYLLLTAIGGVPLPIGFIMANYRMGLLNELCDDGYIDQTNDYFKTTEKGGEYYDMLRLHDKL